MPGSSDESAQLLAQAARTTDDLEARLLVAAAVTSLAREVGVRVVVTGGTAADFYVTGALGTSAAYPALWRPSGDIDVIALSVGPWKPAREALLARLRDAGLPPRGKGPAARVVDIPGVPFYVELVSDELGSAERTERPVTILLDERMPIELRSPENVILAYAESGWRLRHTGDWTRALAVYRAMRDRLDVEWMRLEAARRGQSDVIARIERVEPLRLGGVPE